MGIVVGEEREKGVKNKLKKTVADNFPNLKKERDTRVQEAQKVPKKDESKETYTKTYYHQNILPSKTIS